MITTKEQERAVLEKIKKIVEDLGENSYVGTAFEGCFEIAEDNIANDLSCSMMQKADAACNDMFYFKDLAEHLSKELDSAQKLVQHLQKKLDSELEWKEFESESNVKQFEYDMLVKEMDTRFLTEQEAKDILYDWFGFAKEKIKIHQSVPKYKINRHGQLLKFGSVERRPAYNATDWNYIRFDCSSASYELYNDELHFYLH